MGCDIHAYIEYEEFITAEGKPWMSCFAEDIDIGRNYTLFALMAGVRYDPNRADYKPLFAPRGISKPLSWDVAWKYTLFVSDKDYEDYVKPDEAEKWVVEGSSEWWNDDHTRITHPDWHSASWLNVAELEQIQNAYAAIEEAPMSYYTLNKESIPSEARSMRTAQGYYVEIGTREVLGKYIPLEAVIAAMKALNGDNPNRSRLVFWFDN